MFSDHLKYQMLRDWAEFQVWRPDKTSSCHCRLGPFATRREPLLKANACLAPGRPPPAGGESAPPREASFCCNPSDHKAKCTGSCH